MAVAAVVARRWDIALLLLNRAGRFASVKAAILASIATASSGYLPIADSPESMMQSVPSRMALATSVDSARVGNRLLVIDSSIWVAVMTGLPARPAFAMSCFCRIAI